MNFKAIQISGIISGNLEGNPDVEVSNIARIEQAGKGDLTFLSNPKYEHFIYETKASVVVISQSFVLKEKIEPTLIRVPDAYESMITLMEFYNKIKDDKMIGVDSQTSIHSSVKMGERVFVGAFSSVGQGSVIGNNVKIHQNVTIGEGVEIGDNTIIFSGVNIYHGSKIGNNCVIHSGVVIGADGFGFYPKEDGSYKKVPQIGSVEICDDVEIGANTTIDRATIGLTLISKGVKLDNLIQVGHNVEIGENTVIAAQTGIAGSTKIGKNCTIGGQVGIIGHLKIGDYVKIQAQSGVIRNIKDNEVIQGTPALPYKDFNRSYVVFKHLPEIKKKLDSMDI